MESEQGFAVHILRGRLRDRIPAVSQSSCVRGYKAGTWHVLSVSRCGLAVRRLAGKQKDLGSIHFGSPFSSKNVV